uniref:Octanoyl-[acyl-carrier-protein]:protein N-octanoyltransferase LIPT2, mitochondrial n=1 Tax=Ditylenchus dipsaci TaxID=166011 RepID=A0A915E0K8_9BILA
MAARSSVNACKAFQNHGRKLPLLLCIRTSPVYTVGLREHVSSAEEEQRLIQSGAEFHRVKRGGLITFHGPGQIVVYPVFNLHFLNDPNGATVGVRRYVNLVEDLLVDLLSTRYQIRNVGRTQDTGVWVDNQRKIAAIGIQVRSGVTSHGFALNCNTDLSWFEKIVPCGIQGKATTSISKESGKDVSVEDVLSPVCEAFEKTFGLTVQLNRCDQSANSITEKIFQTRNY